MNRIFRDFRPKDIQQIIQYNFAGEIFANAFRAQKWNSVNPNAERETNAHMEKPNVLQYQTTP